MYITNCNLVNLASSTYSLSSYLMDGTVVVVYNLNIYKILVLMSLDFFFHIYFNLYILY